MFSPTIAVIASLIAGAANSTIAVTPGHCISVPANFQLLGSHGFRIGNVSSGTRTVYGIRDARGNVQKLFILQREAINAGSKTRYVYPLSPAMLIAALPFKPTIFASSNTLAVRSDPTAETAQTLKFLHARQIRFGDLWIIRRYAWHDEAGAIERLIFYMSAVNEDQLSLQNLGPTDVPDWLRAFDQVSAEADAAVRSASCTP